MKVEQLMTWSPRACASDDSAEDAARIMRERDCGFVPVTESRTSRHLAGVLTDRDLCMAAYIRRLPLSQIPVRDVMSRRVISCHKGEDVHEAEQTMRRAQVHRLPVVDETDRLVGVISLADIAREAVREAGTTHQEVTAIELGETLAAIRKPRQIAAVSA